MANVVATAMTAKAKRVKAKRAPRREAAPAKRGPKKAKALRSIAWAVSSGKIIIGSVVVFGDCSLSTIG